MYKPKLSHLAETLIPSEIVRLGATIKEKISSGACIDNFTIGDFDSAEFPIPAKLTREIQRAYTNGYTTYPAADGELTLRRAVSKLLARKLDLHYTPAEILISNGGRPLIYAIYRTIVDKGDKVVYPVPSWNNNHYVNFVGGEHAVVETKKENNFLPTAEELAPHIKGARLISLCSPLNPTGTAFSAKELKKICELLIEENHSRGEHEKKLYMLYDQIYWMLTYGETEHVNPVSLVPEMKYYTLFVDGISKAFAATGVRVGWSMGPEGILTRIRGINSHIGSWAPMAEQHGLAEFLHHDKDVDDYLAELKHNIELRLKAFHKGIQELKAEGFNVDSIEPQAAIYLTIQIDLVGKSTAQGELLENQEMVTQYLLDEAGLAIVPFNCFGANKGSSWYRLSVGTSKLDKIPGVITNLKNALVKLS